MGTGPANPRLPFHHSHIPSQLGGLHRSPLATRTRTNDNHIKTLFVHSIYANTAFSGAMRSVLQPKVPAYNFSIFLQPIRQDKPVPTTFNVTLEVTAAESRQAACYSVFETSVAIDECYPSE
jgi:hypothetical protein